MRDWQILKKARRMLKAGDLEGLRRLKEDNKGSAISFVLGMFILIVIAVNLLPSLALQAANAQGNASVITFGGVVAMIGILVLMFVILPLVILAKATG